MYPLNAILIGRDEESLPHARRELMNCLSRIEAEYPDVRSAIVGLRSSRSVKRLVVLHLANPRELDELSRLGAGLSAWPVVVLINEHDHPNLLSGDGVISLMRAGASQVVALPLRPNDFKAALDRIAVQFAYTERDSPVIAVAGATGGSGATTIAINLAFEIAYKHGLRCILVDLSLKMGVIASHLNIEPTCTILDLIGDPSRVDTVLAQKVLISVADNLEILAGPGKLVAPLAISTQDITQVIDILKQLADVVVLDLPCTYDDVYFDTLANCGQVVLIGEQKLPSIRALKMVHDRLGRASGTKSLVINRFDPRIQAFAVDRLLTPLGVPGLHTVARDDLAMCAAVNRSCALRLVAPRSQALTDIAALTENLLALDFPSPVKPVGLFARLGRALSNT